MVAAAASPYGEDGSRVAFTVQEEGCQELYTVSVDGGPLSQVTFAGADFVRVASWSPDGAAIFFTSSLGRGSAHRLRRRCAAAAAAQ